MANEMYNYYNLEGYFKKRNLNAIDFRFILDIVNTKISMFRYENLPGDLTSEIVEMALMFNNNLCLYNSVALGKVILCKYTIGSEFSIYWKPKTVNLIALNGEPIKYNEDYNKIVLVRDNTMDIIPYLAINEYINKIKEIERTIEINLTIARLPLVFNGTKEQIAQINQCCKAIGDFKGIIVQDKSFNGALTSQKIELQADLQVLYDIKEKYKNECLCSMGIYAIDKKQERLITKEIEAQNDYVDFIYQDELLERTRFVKECNEKFGTNIKLLETYEINREEDAKFQTKQTEEIALAESKGQISVENVKGKYLVESKKVEGDNNDKQNEL